MIKLIDENPFSHLKSGVAPTGSVWMGFLQSFLLVLGAGFLLSGIISFFAYNWDALHRFAKLGIVLALLLTSFGAAYASRQHKLVHQVSITAMCVLVGVFLALAGQIYQTGADSYLLFLTWSLCIVVWAFVANFHPLWLLFVATSLLAAIMAGPQLGLEYPTQHIVCALVGTSFVLAFWLLPKVLGTAPTPKWFMNILFIALATICVVFYELNSIYSHLFVSMFITVLVAAIALVYGKKEYNVSVFALALVLLLFALIDTMIFFTIKDSNDTIVGTILYSAVLSFVGLVLISKAVMHMKRNSPKEELE